MLPIKQVFLAVDVCHGFADLVVHQKYENKGAQPIDVVFMMSKLPFTCHKIALEFTFANGLVQTSETLIQEKRRASSVAKPQPPTFNNNSRLEEVVTDTVGATRIDLG